MYIHDYVNATDSTAIYPAAGSGDLPALAYAALGLSGEVGEVAEKIKKVIRDDEGMVYEDRLAEIQKELGDVAWYWARLHRELGLDPVSTLTLNQYKLLDRKDRGVLKGSGDNR